VTDGWDARELLIVRLSGQVAGTAATAWAKHKIWIGGLRLPWRGKPGLLSFGGETQAGPTVRDLGHGA
jgi:hypothetical protein